MKWFEAANCDFIGYGDDYATRREWERAEAVRAAVEDEDDERGSDNE